jgi:HlyD family secretion protein
VGAKPELRNESNSLEVSWIGRELARDGDGQGERAPGESISVITPLPAPAGTDPSGAVPAIPGARWIAIGVGVALALLAVLAAERYSHKATLVSAGAAGSVPMVNARAPGLTPVMATVSFTGAIQPRYDMPIGTEGETGRITAVYVEAGDTVHKGQLLARLDDSILRPQVDRLEASLEEARANAALAQAEYGRARAVASAGALSAEDIEKRRATALTADAEVKVAAAQLAEYQARLAHTEVRAPVDGLLLTRSAEVGQIATPGGTALFRIAKGGEMEMRAQVAEQDLPSLKVGQPAIVHLTGIDRPFKGKVRLLAAVIDPQTRLGEIRVALGADPQLRPGAFARGEAIAGRGMRPLLPETAVMSDEQGAYVYIVDGQGRIERRSVRFSDTDPRGIVIESGLSGEERVVTTAAAFLRPGERVSVAPAESPSS